MNETANLALRGAMGRRPTETKVLPDLPSGGRCNPAVVRVPPRIEIERLRAFRAHCSNCSEEREKTGGKPAQTIHSRDSEAGNLNFNASRKEFDPDNPGYAAWQHYADSNQWAEATLKRLKSWNFTTIGGWSDFHVFKQLLQSS